MRTTTSAFPWIQGKWRSKEEQRVQVLDLVLKIMVPFCRTVEEGRRVYDNLVKSLAFVLPTNLGLALIFVVALVRRGRKSKPEETE